jgi:hypothetical protein
MAVNCVVKGVHVVPMGFANAFLVEGDDGLTLIDAGFPGKEAAVFGASLSAYEAGTWSVAARTVQAVLPSRRATGAGRPRPALDRWGHTANRRRHRSHSCPRALRGIGRASVASGTNAVRRRCVHEPHGPW